jgi:hypothetical protein
MAYNQKPRPKQDSKTEEEEEKIFLFKVIIL